MTTRLSRERAVLSRERAVTSALDHLHTAAAEPAGFAGKVAVDAAIATRVGATTSGVDVGTPSRSTRRARRRSANPLPGLTRLGAVLIAVFLAGGAAFIGGSTSGGTATPNSVRGFGAAPALGSPGANLDKGVVGIASDPVAAGYWLVAADGGVFAFGKSAFFGSAVGTPLNAPIVGIAATRSGRGYWLVGADGGVFAFGKARFHGSMAGIPLRAPITAIVATRTGHGYWLIGADGGVFAFGDAKYYGSVEGLALTRPVVGAAVTRSGHGYWLVGSDGGVFSFGDARFEGAQPDVSNPAVGIATSSHGHGYLIARADGSVVAFHASPAGNAAPAGSGQPSTVAIATSVKGGYWIAQGAAPAQSLASDPFLSCTRAHESNSAGGYRAVSAGGTYRGAYQFDQSTWNSAARLADRPDLVGVDPAQAAPADQDLLAYDLFRARGGQPWGGRCAGLS